MIKVKRNKDDSATMDIELKGYAEDLAQEYVSLTLELHERYPVVLDRAQKYLEIITKIRNEVDND